MQKKSSEKFFSSQVKCPQNWFACQDLSKCLQPKLVCDNVKDCNDGSDEREFCYEHQKNLIRTEDHTIVY
ncbi:unnamed protein product [Auanema sp. JU1783]|nr:unnamed protein product [Auanema sp. JU1783]